MTADVAAPADARSAAIREVSQRAAAAAASVGRAPAAVRLLAVSKTFPVADVWRLIAEGQLAFGESRVQEAEPKIREVRSRDSRVEWHMIGPLQRNKARRACELFDVIESVDRIELASTLSRIGVERAQTVRIFLEINVDEEPGKAGVAPDAAGALLDRLGKLPKLRVEGLMAIPQRRPDPAQMRPAFARLRMLAEELRLRAPENAPLTELSMGMSQDFEVAIQEGATWIRVGRAIFGSRENTA